MRRIIEKKVIDTDTALLIAEDCGGLGGNGIGSLTERLYRTKKSNYFLCSSRGTLTKYGKSSANQTFGSSEKIISMSKQEAYQWLEKHCEKEVIEELFPDEFEEA